MPRTEKYFVGPALLSDIRKTITRVAGMPDSANAPGFRTATTEMPQRSGGGFRICTFTGAWSLNATKTVTFRGVSTTPNTVAVVNLFLPLPNLGTRNCAIGRDGTAWYLIQAQFDSGTALSAATLGSSNLTFTRVPVLALGTATASVISVTTCPT